MLGVCIEGCKG